MWDESAHPFPNFNGCTVDVWEWINNFTPHFINGFNHLSMLEIYPAARLRAISLDMLQHEFLWEICNIFKRKKIKFNFVIIVALCICSDRDNQGKDPFVYPPTLVAFKYFKPGQLITWRLSISWWFSWSGMLDTMLCISMYTIDFFRRVIAFKSAPLNDALMCP